MTFQKNYEIAKKSMMKKVEEKKNQKIIRNPPKNKKMLGIHPKVYTRVCHMFIIRFFIRFSITSRSPKSKPPKNTLFSIRVTET